MFRIKNLSTGEVAQGRIASLVNATKEAEYLEECSSYDRGHKFGVVIA